MVIRFLLVSLLLIGSLSYADLKDYPHPLICKPVIVRDGITVVSDKADWITLPWSDFLSVGKDKLLFKHLDDVFAVPHVGYICEQ